MRDTPAYFWAPLPGGSLLATDPLNWAKDGPSGLVRCQVGEVTPPPGQQLVFGAYIPQTVIYTYGQMPVVVPPYWGTADCSLTQPSQYVTNGVASYRGLLLLDTYPGEVDVRQSASVMDLQVDGGRIKQNDQGSMPTSAGTITVTQFLFWSAGTINSNSVAGNLDLATFAAGSITPANEGTVTLGSTLTMLENTSASGGGMLEVNEGTIDIENGDGLIVNSRRRLRCAPAIQTRTVPAHIHVQDKRAVPDGNNVIRIDGGATGEVVAAGSTGSGTGTVWRLEVKLTGTSPKVENAGTLTLDSRSDLRFIPTNAGQNAGLWQVQDGTKPKPATVLEAGSKVICEKSTYVHLAAGDLKLKERRDLNGVATAVQPEITIKTVDAPISVDLKNGVTLKRADDTPQVPLKLIIEGPKMSLRCAGVLEFSSMKSVANQNDMILANGKIQFAGTAKLRLFWFASDNGALLPMPAHWTLVKTTFNTPGIPIDGTPPFDPNNPPLLGPTQVLTPVLENDDKELRARRTA